jgi:hypothetical protein
MLDKLGSLETDIGSIPPGLIHKTKILNWEKKKETDQNAKMHRKKNFETEYSGVLLINMASSTGFKSVKGSSFIMPIFFYFYVPISLINMTIVSGS